MGGYWGDAGVMPAMPPGINKQISDWATSIFGFYGKFCLIIIMWRKLYRKYERIYNRPQTKRWLYSIKPTTEGMLYNGQSAT